MPDSNNYGALGVTIDGGTQTGIIGAGTVIINGFYANRVIDAPEPESTGGEPIAACPYPGLDYFGPKEEALFFGRDAAIERLTTAVSRQSLTVLAGASGSGKSSVVLAGLAPHLHGKGRWCFNYFRIGREPDRNPFLALARVLVELDGTAGANPREWAAELQSGQRPLSDRLADILRRNEGSRILLIADQFEEAFTLIEDAAVRQRFIDVLLEGFRDPPPGRSPDVALIMTMRADFCGRAVLYRPLADALQDHVEILGPMKRTELRLAIEKPAAQAKVLFEPGLVDTLLDDVESKPGSLPLLQFALREMWGRQEKRKITREAYAAIGGVQGALAQRAGTIFAEMTEGGRNAARVSHFRRLFTRLVTPGEGQEDTRRVADRSELDDAVWSLAQSLAGETNRLIVTSVSTSGQETAEVVHEALIRNWPTLAGWINQDRAFLSWRLRQIKPNLDLWLHDLADEAPLLRGGMLVRAKEWLDQRRDELNPEEQDFIEASARLDSRKEVERLAAQQAEIRAQQELAEAAGKLAREQVRRTRIAVIGVVVASALAIFGGWMSYEAREQRQYALIQADNAITAQGQADANASRAKSEADRAHVQLLAAQARRTETEATSASDIELGGALALESIKASQAKATGSLEPDAIEAARSALMRLPITNFSQQGGVSSLLVLAGDQLASADGDVIRLWPKQRSGEPMTRSQGSRVNALAALPDGRLISAGQDGKIKVWYKDATVPQVVLSHDSEVLSLAATADGRLVSGGRDGKIKIWSGDFKGAPVVLNHGPEVHFLVALADGRLVSRSDDRNDTLKVWPKGAGEPTVITNSGSVYTMVALPDGGFASGGYDGKVRIWPRDGSGEETPALPHGGLVFSLTVLPDGRVASGGYDGNIKVWPKDFKGEPTVITHGAEVHSLAVFADGKLASGDNGGQIKIWPQAGTGEPVTYPHGDIISGIAVLPDGRLASAGFDGNVKLWPKEGMGRPDTLPQPSQIWSLAELPDGRLVTGGTDGFIRVWPRSGAATPLILPQNAPVWSLLVLKDGRLASGDNAGTIKLWDLGKLGAPGVPVVLNQRIWVRSIAELPDGRLASSGEDGRIRIWAADGRRDPALILTHGNGPVWSLTMLPDGRLVSGGDADGEVRIWPRNFTDEPMVLSHGGPVRALTILADGRLVSGGDNGGKIKVWPRDFNGEPVVFSHGSRLTMLKVLDDGRLASGGGDDHYGDVKLWLVDEKKLVAALCLRAGRNLSKSEWTRYIGDATPWQPSCDGTQSNWRSGQN